MRSNVSVALADDGRRGAATDGIHLPKGVVIVDDMDEAVADPWHALDEADPKVVEGDGDLHDGVVGVAIHGAKQHHVVMVVELAVGDCNGRRSLYKVDDPVIAEGHGQVVEPEVGCSEDADPIAIAPGPPPVVVFASPDGSPLLVDDVVDVYVVDDDIAYKLHGEACSVGNADVEPASVNGLVVVDDQLLLQPNDHVAVEDDP